MRRKLAIPVHEPSASQADLSDRPTGRPRRTPRYAWRGRAMSLARDSAVPMALGPQGPPSGAAQGPSQTVRHFPTGITALGIPDHARTAAACSAPGAPRHRRSKLVAAFALTAIVGLGSYVATHSCSTAGLQAGPQPHGRTGHADLHAPLSSPVRQAGDGTGVAAWPWRSVRTKRDPPSSLAGDSARTAPPMAAASSATMASPRPEPIWRFGTRSAR